MGKCVRIGCYSPVGEPDQVGLGLCEKHSQDFLSGQLGKNEPPARSVFPASDALVMLGNVSEPYESVREVAKRVGVSKDTIWFLRQGRFEHVRLKVWVKLCDAVEHAFEGEDKPRQLRLF